MTTFLHTMVRITDPERSRGFYEALGFRFSRDMDIVRDGELEATNYFFSLGDDENVLELTYNHDGRTYDVGTGYGHIAIGVDDLDGTLGTLKDQHDKADGHDGNHEDTRGDGQVLQAHRPGGITLRRLVTSRYPIANPAQHARGRHRAVHDVFSLSAPNNFAP